MSPDQIAELRRTWAPAIAAQSEVAKEVMRLVDEREALLNACHVAAEDIEPIGSDDFRTLATIRDAIAKAEEPFPAPRPPRES